MIIKSMSRKAPTFAQLAAYIGREARPGPGTAFVRNLYADGRDTTTVVAQFLDNYGYLPARKGGNALYHEVIVLEPQKHLPGWEVEEALHQIAEEYCARRAPHQLAWGQVHHDTEFPHIHLMISANAVRSDRRVRMDRQYFAQVQRGLERWRMENLPELHARVIYGHEHEKQTPRQPVQEGEMVRRTKESSKKQVVFERLRSILAKASSVQDAEAQALNFGLQFYQRGQTWGVQDIQTGKPYRIQALGLATAFERVISGQQKASPPATDDRELDLLQRRMDLQAKQQLRDFDRDDDSCR
jgi:hypothetical protein